ncbi:MAG: hypothetical protein QOD72_863 [Acidimicrobiaceae bacterium]|jgi:hypothetical protein|nr:hypothetical protein [Acidimicrobiaceae bacterium]
MIVDLLDEVARKISDTPVVDRPFAHIIIEGLLPTDIYDEILAALPPSSEMEKVDYPGTGFGGHGAGYRDYGYVYRELATSKSALRLVHETFASPGFSRALLDKFSAPRPDGSTPIPADKHRLFTDADDFSTVFDLQVDLPGYAIAPHPDVRSKIVTFQLYLTADAKLAEYGTLLCEPKDSRAARGRRPSVKIAARAVDRLPRDSALYRRIMRSDLGLALGVGDTANWLPWSWFEVVRVASALPNHFLAFAPNSRSYHAVKMAIPDGAEVRERPVVRGFIRAGKDTSNWIASHH